jgi:pimeloyl-ACP methyl ester carboxylesterase
MVELRGRADLPVLAHVEVEGAGVPVIFLHGLVGLNEHWEGIVERTKEHAKCVRFELPLLDLEDEDCSIDGATELAERFLKSLGERAVLVGNSFGGHIALKLAIGRPDLVRGLVLAGSSGLIEKSMVSDVQIRPSREWLERKIGELFHDKSKMNPGDVDRAFATLNHRQQARAMVKLSKSARRNHLGDYIRNIKCPTLILWGRQDIVTPPEACEQFAKGIPNNRVVWLEECGHAPMLERPADFSVALIEFLRET